ncbi:MAG: SurA N-terminal domain-containing protein [Vicinamibacterales bacterium]
MTMLDRMRRHSNWLKWSLALVCLSFVLFYIPDFLQSTGTGAVASDTVAVVNGQEIRRRRVPSELPGADERVSIRIRRPDERPAPEAARDRPADPPAARGRARRGGRGRSSGREASPTPKWRSGFYAIPAFVENGTFIGQARYQQILLAQNPPLTTAQFEEGIPPCAGPREAAHVGHRLARGLRQGAADRIQAAQRQDQAGGHRLQRRQLPSRCLGDRRRGLHLFRRTQGRLPDS